MADGCHFEKKIVECDILSSVWPILMKFGDGWRHSIFRSIDLGRSWLSTDFQWVIVSPSRMHVSWPKTKLRNLSTRNQLYPVSLYMLNKNIVEQVDKKYTRISVPFSHLIIRSIETSVHELAVVWPSLIIGGLMYTYLQNLLQGSDLPVIKTKYKTLTFATGELSNAITAQAVRLSQTLEHLVMHASV